MTFLSFSRTPWVLTPLVIQIRDLIIKNIGLEGPRNGSTNRSKFNNIIRLGGELGSVEAL